MSRPVTLFTGQWADLTLEELAEKCGGWGFDGLGWRCWGDHFDVAQAVADSDYCAGRREILERHGLSVWAIGNHLVGQAVCDPIDDRHQAILPPEVWGDGDPEAWQRAAEYMKDTARAAAQLGVEVVTGFTGSSTGTSSTRSRRTTSRQSSAATRTSRSAGGRSSTSSRPRA